MTSTTAVSVAASRARSAPSTAGPVPQRGAGRGDERVAGVEDQLCLPGEEVVEGDGRDAGRGGEVLHRRGAVATVGQQLHGRLVQPPALLGGDRLGVQRVTAARQLARGTWAGGRHTRARILGGRVARWCLCANDKRFPS